MSYKHIWTKLDWEKLSFFVCTYIASILIYSYNGTSSGSWKEKGLGGNYSDDKLDARQNMV